MHMLCTSINNTLASGPLVMASIITQSGSAPRTAGARMLVMPGGTIQGTIGGGRYEAEAITHALDLIKKQGNGRSIFFDLDKAGDMDMICGGNILVLLEHISPSEQNKSFSAKAAEAEREGKTFAIVSLLDFKKEDLFQIGSREPINNGSITRYLALHNEENPQLPKEIYPKLQEAWSTGATGLCQTGDNTWLIEPFLPAQRIHIIGGGHVSLALARIAEGVGFASNVLDDRPEFANHTRFPSSKVVQMPSLAENYMDEYFAAERPGARDGIVIVTRGHAFDRDALAAALRTKAGYIGMIGSSAKRKQIYASLLASGFNEQDLARVYSPIGLPIGAETPEEIAVSILAELIQWRYEDKK